MTKFEIKFFAKQKRLFSAIEKQKQFEKKYLKQLYNNTIKFEFNLLHDLEYRLIDRVHDLQSKYYDWHFEKFGFNAY